MNTFRFHYLSISEIGDFFTPFIKMEVGTQLFFCLCLFLLFICIFYLFPFFYVTKSYIFTEREKKRKRSMLKQIMTQKEIEDDVEREIKEEEIQTKGTL